MMIITVHHTGIAWVMWRSNNLKSNLNICKKTNKGL
jgi:hypothetical protein